MIGEGLKSFFENNLNLYNASNAKGIAALYDYPCSIIKETEKIIIPDPETAEVFFESILGIYSHFHLTKVDFHILQTMALSSNIVAVNVKWFFYKIDASSAMEFQTSYILQKQEDWKVLMSIRPGWESFVYQLALKI